MYVCRYVCMYVCMSTSLSSLEKVLFGCEKLTLSRQSSGQTQSYRHYSLSRGHCSPPEQTWTNVICPYLCQVFMSRATSMGSEAVPPRMLGPSWWTSPFAPDCDRWVTAHVFQAFSSYAPVRDVFQSALLSINTSQLPYQFVASDVHTPLAWTIRSCQVPGKTTSMALPREASHFRLACHF